MNVKSFIFGAVVGGCISGVTTYFITKHIVEKNAQTEISEMRNHYISTYVPKKEAVLKDLEKPAPETIVAAYKQSEDKEVYDRAELERPSEDDAPDSYYVDADNPEAIEAMNSDLEAIEYEKNNRYKDPEIIVESEVGAHGFDVSYLTYYKADGILVDSQEQVVDDMHGILGVCLEESGFLENDDTSEEIFIRNYRFGSDYCVSKVLGKWDI